MVKKLEMISVLKERKKERKLYSKLTLIEHNCSPDLV
jgi:hypothetical protein